MSGRMSGRNNGGRTGRKEENASAKNWEEANMEGLEVAGLRRCPGK